MLGLLDRLPWRRQKGYSCYFVVLHFPSAEQAAEWYVDNFKVAHECRMMRGGERIPLCPTPEGEE